MWFGTYMDGLYCIDKGKISHYLFPVREGMDLNNIRTLTEDIEGNLWVSVNGGVGSLIFGQASWICWLTNTPNCLDLR